MDCFKFMATFIKIISIFWLSYTKASAVAPETKTFTSNIRHEIFEIPDIDMEYPVFIDIESKLPGNLYWKPTDNASISLDIKLYNDIAVRKIALATNISENKLSIVISDVQEIVIKTSQSFQYNSATKTSFNVFPVIVVALVLFNRKMALLVGILVPLYAMSKVTGQYSTPGQSCNITIFYPRNSTFDKINITIANGKISAPPMSHFTNTSDVFCTTSSSDTGCPSCCYGNGICGRGDFCICKPGYEESSYCETEKKPKRTLYINEVDPRMAKIESIHDVTYLMLGKRRSSGSFKSLTAIRTRDSFNKDIVIHFKNGKYVKEIISIHEEKILLRWLNACNLSLRLWKGNTTYSTKSLHVNICSHAVGLKPTGSKVFPSYFQNFNGLSMNSNHAERQTLRIPNDKKRIFHKKSRLKVPIEVKRCDQPDFDSTVFVDVIDNGTSRGIDSPVRFTAIPSYIPGLFEAKLPLQSEVQLSMKKRMCKSFKKLSNRLCSPRFGENGNENAKNVKFQQCYMMRDLLLRYNVTTESETDGILETCLLGLQRVKNACDELQSLIIGDYCEGFFDTLKNFYIREDMPITFSGYFSDGHIVRSHVYNIDTKSRISAKSQTKIILKGRNDIPKILNFTVFPQNPKSKDLYKVTVNYSCARPTTKVHVQIVGSDQYTNYVTCAGLQKCNCCVLHVAGATGNVTDKVIVDIVDTSLDFKAKKEFFVPNY